METQDEHSQKNKKSNKAKSTFFKFIRGDLLVNNLSKEAFTIIFFVVVLGVHYISNIYTVQQRLLEINKLKIELQDIKYNALTKKAILLNKSRQSNIEDILKARGSELEIPTTPPFLIK